MAPHCVLRVQKINFHWLALCPVRCVTPMHSRLWGANPAPAALATQGLREITEAHAQNVWLEPSNLQKETHRARRVLIIPIRLPEVCKTQTVSVILASLGPTAVLATRARLLPTNLQLDLPAVRDVLSIQIRRPRAHRKMGASVVQDSKPKTVSASNALLPSSRPCGDLNRVPIAIRRNTRLDQTLHIAYVNWALLDSQNASKSFEH